MIEKCNVCQKEHNTGEGDINGMPYKTCPEMPVDKVFFWNPEKYYGMDRANAVALVNLMNPDVFTGTTFTTILNPITLNKDD